MTIALVQSTIIVGGLNTSATAPYPNPVTAGNLLVIGVQSQSPGVVFTVTDPNNNAWHFDLTSTGQIWQAGIASVPNCSSGTTNVTVTQLGPAAQFYFVLEEWSGIIQSNPFDQSSSHSATSVTPDSGASGPIGQVPELVVGLIATTSVGNIFPGPGYNNDKQNFSIGMEYKFLTSGTDVGTQQTATWTLPGSQAYLALVATYRGVGQAGPTPRQYYVMP